MTATVLALRVSAPQPGGPPVDKYTYGFAYQAINGVSFVGHNGGTPGYEGQIDIYPQTDYVVVILANQDQVLVPAIPKVGGHAHRLIAERAGARESRTAPPAGIRPNPH